MQKFVRFKFSHLAKIPKPLWRKIFSKKYVDEIQEAFNQKFEREILYSERLRLLSLAAVSAVSLISFLLFYLFFRLDYQRVFLGKLPIIGVVLFLCILILYSLQFSHLILQDIKAGRKCKVWRRYLTAFAETSIPTVGMLLLAQIYQPVTPLFTPIPFVYFYFIILSALRLNFKVCVFTGTVAAVEYIALYHYCINASNLNSLSVGLDLLSIINHAQRSSILFLAGILTGVVTIQIKKRIVKSLRSMDDKNQILRVFGQHVSPAVVNRLLDQRRDLGSETRYVCIMFLDIRNFTSYSENRPPEDVVNYLNTLFDFMIDIVNCNHGIINKFLGDGFMAVFGAPISNGNDCQNAVTASLEIIERIKQEIAVGNIPPTRIGVGLHCGAAVTGTVGSNLRQEYTVIGDVVNLASRIEQLNKEFRSQVLISEAVWDAVDKNIKDVAELGKIQVKGRETPVSIYKLV